MTHDAGLAAQLARFAADIDPGGGASGKAVLRSSTPRSPAGIATSRMQRSGRRSAQSRAADGPSAAVMVW